MPQPTLAIGAQAPDFSLPSTSGTTVQLYRELEHSSVVLFFYVKAFTPVCMAEVCSFRNRLPEFNSSNCAVYGISSDSESVAKRFALFHQLPFPLLLDERGVVRNLYSVPKLFGFLPGRATYVISQDRRILQITHGSLESARHVNESLDILRGLAPK